MILGKVGAKPYGTFVPGTSYPYLALVDFGGGSYLSRIYNNTEPLNNTVAWMPITKKGDKGDPFEFEDFTPEQLDSLKGADGTAFNIQQKTFANYADLVAWAAAQPLGVSHANKAYMVNAYSTYPELTYVWDGGGFQAEGQGFKLQGADGLANYSQWQEQSYTDGAQVFKNLSVWEAQGNTLSTDIPGESPKWKLIIGNNIKKIGNTLSVITEVSTGTEDILLSDEDITTWDTFNGSTTTGGIATIPYNTAGGFRAVIYKDGTFGLNSGMKKIVVNCTAQSGQCWIGVDDSASGGLAMAFQQDLVLGINEFVFDSSVVVNTTVIIRQETSGTTVIDDIKIYDTSSSYTQEDVIIQLSPTSNELLGLSTRKYINNTDFTTYLLSHDVSLLTATVLDGAITLTPTGAGATMKNKKVVLSESAILSYTYKENAIGDNQFGFSSINGFGYGWDVFASFVTNSSDGNFGKIKISAKSIGGAYTSYSTTSNSNYTLGDVLRVSVKRIGLTYTFIVINITKGWTIQHSVSCTPLGTPFVAHNSAKPTIKPATSITVYSEIYEIIDINNLDIIAIGDSITFGQAATTEAGRYANQINSVISVSGGGADTTAEVLARIDEIIFIDPRRVTLMIGGNDILFGVSSATWQANLRSICNQLRNVGIEVIHLYPTPRSGASTLISFIQSEPTFISDMKIDTNTPLMNGNANTLAAAYNSGDGLHLNNAGMVLDASSINTALGL